MNTLFKKVVCIAMLAMYTGYAHGMQQLPDAEIRQAVTGLLSGGVHALIKVITLPYTFAQCAIHGVHTIAQLPGKAARGIIHGAYSAAIVAAKAVKITCQEAPHCADIVQENLVRFTKQNPKKVIALGAAGAYLFSRSRFAHNAAQATKLLFINRLLRSNNRLLIAIALRLGANINHRFIGSKTAIHIASEEGHADIVEYLIANGANIAQLDSQGLAPIHYAAKNGHIAVADRLIHAGEDINRRSDHSKRLKGPLHMAVSNMQLPMVKWLVQHGANTNQLDSDNFDPRGYLVRYYGNTSHYTNYQPEDINAFFDRLNPHHVNHFTDRLQQAIDARNIQQARIAINSDATLVDENPDRTPLLRTIRDYDRKNPTPLDEIAKALVKAGTPMHIADSQGSTPLHYAATHSNIRLAKLFLGHGANAQAQNNGHESLLDIALRNQDLHMINLLRVNGAQLTSEQLATSPWFVASHVKQPVMPDTVEEAPADAVQK
jgi:FOG: Ankyrin repeat